MKVINMTGRTGDAVPNQFIIRDGDSTWFQSYHVIVAREWNGKVYLDEKFWNYSKTTSKYLAKFLGVDCKEIKKRVNSGEYELVNLN